MQLLLDSLRTAGVGIPPGADTSQIEALTLATLRDQATTGATRDTIYLALLVAYQRRGLMLARQLLRRGMHPGLSAVRRETGRPSEEIEAAFLDTLADYPTEHLTTTVAANLQKATLHTLLAPLGRRGKEEEAGEAVAVILESGGELSELFGANEDRPVDLPTAQAIIGVWRCADIIDDIDQDILLSAILGARASRVRLDLDLSEEAIKQRKHRIKEKLEAARGCAI
jgi:hypothetical protein